MDGGMDHKRSLKAFSLPELMALTAISVLIMLALLPWFSRNRHRDHFQTKCANNLRNVGLAFRIFAADNNDLLPFQIDGPIVTKGFVAKEDAFKHFLALSNELSTPKIILCPKDSGRIDATNWSGFSNANLSYFVGLTAAQTMPQSIVSGDRNLLTNGLATGPGLLMLDPRLAITFSTQMHNQKGNVCFGDGSVRSLSSAQLQQALTGWGGATNKLLLP
jgi:prepilin-type processing-associated H-X9-DG protein